MKINQLSAIKIRSLAKPGYYLDGQGLYLQVSKTGTKSWIFRYARDGKSYEMGLGSMQTVGLSDARSKAHDCRVQRLKGINPIEDRSAQRSLEKQSVTFSYCAKQYIETHKADWKNAKHTSQWTNTLKTYVEPIIGALPVNKIDTAAVMRVLSPIWQTKTETATRVRQRIEVVLGWAGVMGHRPQSDNPARWKGHLDNLLPTIAKSKRLKHHPSLPWADMGAFMHALRQMQGTAARALEFGILTAARSGEVRGAMWDEIRDGMWIVPADRMKAGREHQVPLSKQALALLEKLPRSTYIFEGLNGVMSDATMASVIKRMKRSGITVHGFRSTFRMWCAETAASSFGRDVAEHALAHSLPDKVEAAYQRSTLFDKRKALMQAWADFADISVTGNNVIQIRGVA